MSIATHFKPDSILPPPEDPFYYGWRYVERKLPDGSTEWEQVPLTLEDVLHPEEGDCIVNNTAHDDTLRYLKGEELITHLGREYYD